MSVFTAAHRAILKCEESVVVLARVGADASSAQAEQSSALLQAGLF